MDIKKQTHTHVQSSSKLVLIVILFITAVIFIIAHHFSAVFQQKVDSRCLIAVARQKCLNARIAGEPHTLHLSWCLVVVVMVSWDTKPRI